MDEPEVVSSGEDATVRIVYEPKGVICIIGTWNSPLSTCIHPLAEALAHGNGVVLKPSELFPHDLLQGVSSGGVTINGIIMHNVHPVLPFGGVNNSGIGSFHGIHGFKELSHARVVYHIL